MTYLITSNTQATGLNVPDTSGINNPSSYVNMLSQTFEIEPNSEIAVESLKITRNGNIQLSSANNKFGIYLGDKLGGVQGGLSDNLGFPVPTRITGGNVTRSPTSLCSNIREGFQQGLGQHPNFVPIDANFPKVELKNGSNLFTGFKYSFTQNASTHKTHIPPTAGDWVATDAVNLNAIVSASGSHGVILKKSDPEELVGDLGVIGTTYPINQANGSVVFSFNSSLNGSAGELWEVGLTRATFNEKQVPGSENLAGSPQGYEEIGSVSRFFDYSVRPNPVSGSFEVFCCAVNGTDAFGFPKRSKVKVGGVPNVSLTSSGSGTTQFQKIKFIVKGDTVNVELISANGSITKLCENTGSKANSTKPISISNFYLYPKVNIYDNPSASRVMVVDGYDGLNIPTLNFDSKVSSSFEYGGRFKGKALEPAILGYELTGPLTYQDYYSTALWTGKGGNLSIMEERPALDYGDTYDPERQEVNASGYISKDIVIISAPSSLYSGEIQPGTVPAEDVASAQKFNGGWTDRFGAQNILGFENVPVQVTNTFTLPGKNLAEKESKTTPKMISNKSLFVRLPDLPINSFNSGKGSVSKILYHMPRFDNSGNEVGGLYYQPPERLYIPLRNTTPIRLNNIKVELCNIDETNKDTDLVGQTIICFDIRKARV